MLMQMQNQKNILYGISTKFALSGIDDKLHPELYIFVEDEEAETIVNEIIKKFDDAGQVLKRVEIKPIGSYSVVDLFAGLIIDKKLPYKGFAIVDGDKVSECKNGCLGLPGMEAPERQVIKDLKAENWNNLENRFGIGSGTLYQILDDALLVPDHHEWTTYIGDRIKQSKSYVWSVLVEEWCKQCLNEGECRIIYDAILEKLNE